MNLRSAAMFLLEGDLTTRMLNDRGKSRLFFSRILTKRMRKKLLQFQSGSLALPIAGSSDLPAVSLTSWPPRYSSLPLVLLNLLDQNLLPSRIIVWLTSHDYALFDRELREFFEQSIVKFCKTEDYGPHKKWLPMLTETSKPFVICDDDIFYPRGWYRSLVASDDGRSYVGHKCHILSTLSNSSDISISPYSSWQKSIQRADAPSHDFFVVGCGGGLLHPTRIPPAFRDWSNISRLCPKADDIWLKLAHLSGEFPCKKSHYNFPCIEYAESQTVSLLHDNVGAGGNDKQLIQSLSELSIDLSLISRR